MKTRERLNFRLIINTPHSSSRRLIAIRLWREQRTVNVLTSHYVEMSKSIPFQQEYAAANNMAEQAVVVQKYSYVTFQSPCQQIAKADVSRKLTVIDVGLNEY